MLFLNPIWLFGAAAIVIPVVIHLWNVRSGKILKVGSISLIAAASRKSSRSFKLLDIPLFLLRCLLLLLLALLLALPVWQKKLQATKVKGWVLISKENFTATYQKFKPRIDSLTKAGYEFHYFNSGFAKSNLQQILLNPKDSLQTQLPTLNTPLLHYWNLARQLNNSIASTLPVYVFTPNQASNFTGSKPQVALNLNWQTYIPADSVSSYIHDAWFTNNGDIRVVQGTSKPSGTTYSYNNIKANDRSNAYFTLSASNGKAQVSLPNSKQAPITIDTVAQSILIYADKNAVDAGYLKAALQAVSQFSQRNISIKSISNPNQIPAHTAWLFWLSNKTINNQVKKNSQNIFTYEKGNPANVKSWISNRGRFSTALANDDKVDLFKLINSNNNYEPVWQDGFSHPVLSMQQQGQSNIYHYYSRFNPAWNNLVWSDAFPAWLLKLMLVPTKTDAWLYDRRVLSQQQYMPEIINESHTVATENPVENKSLTRYFWLALIIIFAAERWLAHRTLKTTTT
ncbi:BatA domain-containing protein [Mucilaginibacter terrae]|uniref:BatA domain-containing protein n=1 Tax=Mucilaginibacter terrae TaxID=1955052 RepID=UPI003636A1A9